MLDMSAHSNFGIIRDKKPVTGTWTILERGLNKLIASNFLDYKDFYVISNLKKYKPSMDESIFNQKIGKTAEIAEVYWKGEFVCEVSIFDSPDKALLKINDGMIEHITKKKG